MCKLNGGLGTGMGLEKAKSLLPVHGDYTFLDLIAKQVEASDGMKFMLMNSFSTSDDTAAFLKKYPSIVGDESWQFVQNKSPKVVVDDGNPAVYESNPDLEWCPPGHGDLYAAIVEEKFGEQNFRVFSEMRGLFSYIDPKI